MIRKHIPNAITCLNLFSGCVATALAFQGAWLTAALFVALAAAFDFMDGFAARLLKAYSPMGKELDSLADVVSFGVAPAALVYNFLTEQTLTSFNPPIPAWTAFLLPVFSALRLAKFNLDDQQKENFIGLPTPANGLFWAFGIGSSFEFMLDSSLDPIYMIAGILLFSWLMVSNLPMFSLKFKHYRFKGNRLRWYFLAGCILLIAFLGLPGVSACILWYILLSVVNAGFVKKAE